MLLSFGQDVSIVICGFHCPMARLARASSAGIWLGHFKATIFPPP